MQLSRRDFILFAAAIPGVLALAASDSLGASASSASEGKTTMKYREITIAHFSPTGSTAKIAVHLGNALADRVTQLDLSAQKLEAHSVSTGISIVAVPVYSGRVPARAVEAIRLLSGNGQPCVAVVVYGNRAFDDALIELMDILGEQNFKIIAAGGFIAQHALVAEIATGRPDAKDLADVNSFGQTILDIAASGKISTSLQVPGNRPYVTSPASKIPIMVGESCINCGRCAEHCPVAAIPIDSFSSTNIEKCILCMRCVCNCPVDARSLPQQAQEKLSAFLQKYAERRDPQTFI